MLLLLVTGSVSAQSQTGETASDSTVYQGTFVKLDLFTPIYEAIRSAGKLQCYELGVNVRLQNRFYPTLEGGYAFGEAQRDSLTGSVRGGFLRIGMDYNPLKKSRHLPHALLLGLRVGTSLQQQCDAWGELNVGCQVQIVSGFYMGWAGRMRILFTGRDAGADSAPIYIPGFGYRDHLAWGADYFLGWRF